MKRKTLFLLSILTISATLLSGCKSADSVDSSETIETTAVETEAIETEIAEATETIEETETEFIAESALQDDIAKNKVYPDVNPEEVDPKTTQMDADTKTALSQQERKEIGAQWGGYDAWTEYAKSQGADNTLGWCWIYYTGRGAGTEESYAVYMKEDSPRYGEVFHLGDYLPGGDFFVGANVEEMGIADIRLGQRQVENGERDGITFNEDGTVTIVID